MKKSILLFMGVLSTLSWNANAGGFKIALQGQKQTAMGGTGVGFAQDAATIYYNPAGMSFINDQVNAGVNLLIPSTGFLEKSTNTSIRSEKQSFTPFSLYGNYSVGKHLDVGLGIYTPFGTGVKYPGDWTGRYILTEIKLQTIFFQPTISYKISKSLSVGAGFIYSTGNVSLEKDLPLASGQSSVIGHAKLSGAGNGMGFNAGAYFKATEKLHIGATYHSQVNMKVDKGDATFTNIPTALASTFPASNTFSTTLALPSEVAIGASYKLTDALTLAVDFNHTFWKSYDSLGFDYAVNTSSITDAKSPRLYENASCIRFGAQYVSSKELTLRGGLFFDQTPVKDGYVAPELPDNNKIGLSAGATYKLDQRLQIDLSLLYENVPARQQKNLESGLEGTFRTQVIAPGIGLTYLFTKKTDKK